MKTDKVNLNHKPAFGMQFKLTRLSPSGDWYGADREFFNSTYQIGLLTSAAKKLKPKSDILEMQLDLPQSENIFPDSDGKLKHSYKMIANIIRKGKIIESHDLSEKDVVLDYFNAMDRFEVHPKGPCNKMIDFIRNRLTKTK